MKGRCVDSETENTAHEDTPDTEMGAADGFDRGNLSNGFVRLWIVSGAVRQKSKCGRSPNGIFI